MTGSKNNVSVDSVPNGVSSVRASTNGTEAANGTSGNAKGKQLRDNYSATILDLLFRAARYAPTKGMMFLENGINSAPKIQSYSELYETAKVKTQVSQ